MIDSCISEIHQKLYYNLKLNQRIYSTLTLCRTPLSGLGPNVFINYILTVSCKHNILDYDINQKLCSNPQIQRAEYENNNNNNLLCLDRL